MKKCGFDRSRVRVDDYNIIIALIVKYLRVPTLFKVIKCT